MRNLSFQYSSAGIHVPPLVVTTGRASELFGQSDFPIGHVRDHEYATERASFAAGDVFLFASDGVTEARHGEEPYGMERLKSEALRIRKARGNLEVEEVVASVRAFLGEEPTRDDMCLLAMTFEGPWDPTR
jgi:sigma-B regulation protein RsbU (phosphoserine phosphatase)